MSEQVFFNHRFEIGEVVTVMEMWASSPDKQTSMNNIAVMAAEPQRLWDFKLINLTVVGVSTHAPKDREFILKDKEGRSWYNSPRMHPEGHFCDYFYTSPPETLLNESIDSGKESYWVAGLLSTQLDYLEAHHRDLFDQFHGTDITGSTSIMRVRHFMQNIMEAYAQLRPGWHVRQAHLGLSEEKTHLRVHSFHFCAPLGKDLPANQMPPRIRDFNHKHLITE